MDEAGICASVVRYATGGQALQAWERVRPAWDVIVIADVLPMLTPQEFINAARTVCPEVPVVIAGEMLQPAPLLLSGVHQIAKPVSTAEVRTVQRMFSGRRSRVRRAA